MKKLLIAGAFALLCASPAFAGDRDDNSCKGNCPNNGGGAPSSSTSTGVGVGVGVGVGIGQGGAGGAGGQGGEGGRGGAGGVGLGGSATQGQDQMQGQLQGQQQGQVAFSDQGQSQALTASQANQQTANSASGATASGGNASGQSTTVNTVTNYKRSAASAAWTSGSTGSDKTCRYGPAGSAQWLGGGGSVSLTVLKDPECAALLEAENERADRAALIEMARAVADLAGSPEAGIQYLAAKDAAVNAAVTLARTR